jgi:hypothetical protein
MDDQYCKNNHEGKPYDEMMGGEGVGRVGRYLWYTLSSEKAKMNYPFQGGENGKKRKRKT